MAKVSKLLLGVVTQKSPGTLLGESHHSAEHWDLYAAELSALNCTASLGTACLKSFLHSVVYISHHCSHLY